jgi:hypothetical protein
MSFNIEHIIQQENWLSGINKQNFEQYALTLFQYQFSANEIYRSFATAIGKEPATVGCLTDIPFLPISLFKTHEVVTGKFVPQLAFESSGTTGMQNSKHLVKDPDLYKASFLQTFREFYGAPEDYVFLCLLPSYLERNNSSLVYMAAELIRQSKQEESGFYLNEWEQLAATLNTLAQTDRKVMLLGVTFALLDFADQYPMDLSNITVMETGGMKGRREEWTRDQVHDFLKVKWQLPAVHSEYGMTELLSQAYSRGEGLFECPSVLKVLVRDESDPFDINQQGNGCINVIDLANVHSCAFIATDDIARIRPDGKFEITGRLDHSALRGCSLMVV